MKLSLVKTFLILNFILIIAVMTFSMFFFFKDRELLNARTLMTYRGVEKVAENLRWSGTVSWEDAEARKTEAFSITIPTTVDEVAGFEARLKDLEEYAGFRIEQLEQVFATLETTRAELAQTNETINIREQELRAARQEISQLEDTLAQTESRLDEANDTIGDLEREKSTLERQVKDLETELASKDKEIAILEEEIALRQTEYEKLKKLWDACRGFNPTKPNPEPEPGMSAEILAIDPEWEFAIINRGEVDVLPMFSEAFVHRGETYVGKIRVTQVESGAAIAEILTDTFEAGAKLEVGDTVFFPNENQ